MQLAFPPELTGSKRVAGTGTTAPPSTSDPGFNDFEQGTIASATGVKRDGASDVATRIRLKAPVAVDRSWQALKFDGGSKGSDASVTVFAYDANGHMDYEIYRNAAQSQYFEAVFYDPDNHYFGGVNANTGVGYFWDDTNFSFTATPPAPVVTGVSVTPSAVTVSRGGTQSFTATVTGDGHPAQSVTWSVRGNASTGTTIDGEGLLTVASDETARALTVAATSTADASRSATATVAIPWPGRFGGFRPPVKSDGVNGVHAGRTIPIKWTIDGEEDGESAVVSATFDEPGAEYHWIGELGSYHLNVDTPRSWAGSRRTFTVMLADGSLHRAEFAFK
ncbi:PxKF domain-containing protein [Microbispora bryophytorum]|uniref:PxKF domain-containing protein n=1 Tax=Microbispora bryophytorum TaxID=1460882 RepID=UPI0033D853D0